jgi:hypothetical protein
MSKKFDIEGFNILDFIDSENTEKTFLSYSEKFNFGVKPMFVLNGDVLVVNGDGTAKNPYEFGDRKKVKYGEKLSERDTGEYVYINGILFRIIDTIKDGTTRIVSMDSLGITLDDSVETYSDPNVENIIYNPKDKNSVGYYINNRVSEYLDTSYFVNYEVSVPIYGDEIIYGKELETKKYTVKLAAPNMFELFSAQGKHYYEGYDLYSYWMVNSSKTKRIAGAVTDIGVPMNEKIVPYKKFGVRVVASVNKNRVVVSGKGSFFDPYKIN